MVVDIYNTDKKYNIIYADPPWQWTKEHKDRGSSRAVEKEYSTMSFEELCGMKESIQNISEKDSILFMWVTAPKLKIALELIEKWGYIYKTVGFVWIKKNKKITVISGEWDFILEQMQSIV